MRTSPASRARRLVTAAALALAIALPTTLAATAPAQAAAAPAITIYVPNLVQSGVPSTLVAVVSQDPSLGAPTGTVTFLSGYGPVLGTGTLVAGTNGQSTATYTWTPPPAFSVPVLATYTATGSTTSTATSVIMNPEISSAPVPVALRFAPTLTAGPQVLSGVLGYDFGPGSVSFLVDGKGWTGSVPTVDGVGSVTWQATAGVHTIVVQYSSNATNPAGIPLQTGSSTQVVYVQP